MLKELIIKGKVLASDKVSICVPIVAKTADEILSAVDKCVSEDVPVIELRADCFDCLEDTDRLIDLLEQIKALTENTIVIFTIRTSLEGGNADMPEALYKDVLMRVSAADAVDIIDVEASHILEGEEFTNQLHNNGTYVLASHHDFEKTPELLDLMEIYDGLEATGADIIKLAVMPKEPADVLRIFKAAQFADDDLDALVIMIAMGDMGKVTRVAGKLVGSCITFASMGELSAPGQIDFSEMKALLKALDF